MMSRSKESERVAAMVKAMRENGPMSVPELVAAIGWCHETIRTQIRKSTDTFMQMSDRTPVFGGSVAAVFYLTNSALGISEEELDQRADEIYRDFSWWPKADSLVISTINAMIKSGAQAWHQ
ncbi:hypothetical protein [Paraburkholderia graminis]|uniref:hypothetical protein n=1 Tax=Paraburkholderia graminis TaxID=60548 RepID=UPI0038B76B47